MVLLIPFGGQRPILHWVWSQCGSSKALGHPFSVVHQREDCRVRVHGKMSPRRVPRRVLHQPVMDDGYLHFFSPFCLSSCWISGTWELAQIKSVPWFSMMVQSSTPIKMICLVDASWTSMMLLWERERTTCFFAPTTVFPHSSAENDGSTPGRTTHPTKSAAGTIFTTVLFSSPGVVDEIRRTCP